MGCCREKIQGCDVFYNSLTIDFIDFELHVLCIHFHLLSISQQQKLALENSSKEEVFNLFCQQTKRA